MNIEKPRLLLLTFFQVLLLVVALNAQALEFELLVESADKACDVATDCALVYEKCDSCSCGVGVNRKHQERYRNRLEELCEGFSGPHCDKLCAPVGFRCIDSRCIASFAGEKAP